MGSVCLLPGVDRVCVHPHPRSPVEGSLRSCSSLGQDCHGQRWVHRNTDGQAIIIHVSRVLYSSGSVHSRWAPCAPSISVHPPTPAPELGRHISSTTVCSSGSVGCWPGTGFGCGGELLFGAGQLVFLGESGGWVMYQGEMLLGVMEDNG